MHGSMHSPETPWDRRPVNEQNAGGERVAAQSRPPQQEPEDEDTFDEFVSRVGLPTLASSVFVLAVLLITAAALIVTKLAAAG